MSLLAPGIAMGIPSAQANGVAINFSLIHKAGVVALNLIGGSTIVGAPNPQQLGYMATLPFTPGAPPGIGNASFDLSAYNGGSVHMPAGIVSSITIPAALLIDASKPGAYLPAGTVAPSPLAAYSFPLLTDAVSGKGYIINTAPPPNQIDSANIALLIDAPSNKAYSEYTVPSRVSGITVLTDAPSGNAYY